MPATLFDVPWEDVLVPKVLGPLSLADKFRFRRVCSQARQLVDECVLPAMKKVNLGHSISDAMRTTPADVRAKRRAFKVLSRCCRNVRILNLTSCLWLDDRLLHAFLTANERLVEVRLSNCRNLTAVSLQPLILGLKQLQVLHLRNCPWMTNGALDALTFHHSRLVAVDLAGCLGLSEESILKFVKKFKRLQVLSLNDMPAVTDVTLAAVAKHCLEMKFLSVLRCPITETGVVALNRRLLYLKILK